MESKKDYYMVDIQYPTNSGYWSTRKIFNSEEDAMAFVTDYLESNNMTMDDLIDDKNEWTAGGPNWETLHDWHSEDEDCISLMVIHQ